MSRFGGLSEERSSVFKPQASLVLFHQPNAVGMKGRVDLTHSVNRTQDLCPGVDISRCKDHMVFRIHRIACSRFRKVVRNFVPEKAYMRRDPLKMNRVPIRKLLKKVKNTPAAAVTDRWPIR
ncbi:hypothetical protein TNCV_5035401 [Trichonephila clavipes]|nr:hypothetical protein TNCV_5035401 [Trichonephila clavipes]